MDCPEAGRGAGVVIGDLLMSGVPGGQDGGKTRRGVLAFAIGAAVLIGAAAVLYVIGHHGGKPGGASGLTALAHGEMAKLTVSSGAAAPDTPILDPAGKPVRFNDIAAPVTVVNLWATWCPPCVKEMPTLAALQTAYGSRVRVAAISMDKTDDREKARAFIGEHPPLVFYQDPKSAFAFGLDPAAEGYPTTVIYDRKGHERARLSGGADWNGPDARAVIDALLAER
jgi:thiol-disulfide isomerase/thioredoxin